MGAVPPGPLSGIVSLQPVLFTVKSEYGRARACVVIDKNGPNEKLYNLKSFSVNRNAHGATNNASFVVPYAGNPDWTGELFRDTSAGTTNIKPVYVEIWAGFPKNPGPTPSTDGLSRRFYGIVDTYDPEDMAQTEFRLRSIAAPLTTDRITTSLQNITTVQFIQQMGAKYGIPVSIDPSLASPGSGTPGPLTLAKVYAQEFVVGLRNLVIWDVMLRSSVFDDADIWEDNGTIYYWHPWNVPRKTLELLYGSNVKKFSGAHAPQFSRNIKVQVHSYRAKTRVSVTSRLASLVGGGAELAQSVKTSYAVPTFGLNQVKTNTYDANGNLVNTRLVTTTGGPASSTTQPITESGTENYDFWIPNLTPDECNSLVAAVWREISMHEYQGQFTLAVTPSNLDYLAIESLFDFNGYGMSKFNTQYWPRDIQETFQGASNEGANEAQGWEVVVKSVNHTPPLGAV